MPNWCNNEVRLFHESLRQVKRAADALTEGRFCSEFLWVPNDLLPQEFPQDKEMEAYRRLEARKEENLKRYGFASWYEFCLNKWGTKWDVKSEYVNHEGHYLTATFDSAWSPPTGVYYELQRQGFTVLAYYYEPGLAFAGKFSDDGDETFEIGTLEDAKNLPEDLDKAMNISEQLSSIEED